jgi:hypothetical protein
MVYYAVLKTRTRLSNSRGKTLMLVDGLCVRHRTANYVDSFKGGEKECRPQNYTLKKKYTNGNDKKIN